MDNTLAAIFIVMFGSVMLALIFRRREPVIQQVEVSVPTIPREFVMALADGNAYVDDAESAVVFEIDGTKFKIDSEDKLHYWFEASSLGLRDGKWREANMKSLLKFLTPIAVEIDLRQRALGGQQVARRLKQQQHQQNPQRKQLQPPQVPQRGGQPKQPPPRGNQQQNDKPKPCQPDKARNYAKNGVIFEDDSFLLPSGFYWWQIDDASDPNDGKWYIYEA